MSENLRAAVRWTFKVVGPEDADALSDSAERVMEALLDLEACDSLLSDSGVAMDADDMLVDVELTVAGTSAPDTLRYAQAAIRTAIHAAGHGTPDWPNDPQDRVSSSVGKYHPQQVEMLAS
ncbi:hypothetical protein [Streptomyces hydrogenans]|uniref:hypothetical protein n=1 Tax=Streptomyces hydrogenans TaxID=1873719 RepID=UPI00381AF60E